MTKPKPISVRNPQANVVVERVHQVIGNIIWTFELENNYIDEEDPWKGILSATAFAVRSTFHTTLRNTPGHQIVFGRDMVLNIKHEASREDIWKRKQQAERTTHTYRIGDQVLRRRGTKNHYETLYKKAHTL